jgi:hypothetical protein
MAFARPHVGVDAGGPNRRRGREASRLSTISALAVTFLALLAAVAMGSPSETYVEVASGKVAGHRWNLGVLAYNGRRCFKLSLTGRTYGETTACGESTAAPSQLWRRLSGASDESASVELDLTSTRVWRLTLLLGHPGLHPRHSTWQSVPTRMISPAQATSAHLTRNFRFAVLTGRGPNLCVEKVRAFGREGNLLEKLSVPCEY